MVVVGITDNLLLFYPGTFGGLYLASASGGVPYVLIYEGEGHPGRADLYLGQRARFHPRYGHPRGRSGLLQEADRLCGRGRGPHRGRILRRQRRKGGEPEGNVRVHEGIRGLRAVNRPIGPSCILAGPFR